jgi:hypothetical protein
LWFWVVLAASIRAVPIEVRRFKDGADDSLLANELFVLCIGIARWDFVAVEVIDVARSSDHSANVGIPLYPAFFGRQQGHDELSANSQLERK